jgi:hypothetical protein
MPPYQGIYPDCQKLEVPSLLVLRSRSCVLSSALTRVNRQRVGASNDGNNEQHASDQEIGADPDAHATESPPKSQGPGQQHPSVGQNGVSPRSYQKSASISASKCVVVNPNKKPEVLMLYYLNSPLIIAFFLGEIDCCN